MASSVRTLSGYCPDTLQNVPEILRTLSKTLRTLSGLAPIQNKNNNRFRSRYKTKQNKTKQNKTANRRNSGCG